MNLAQTKALCYKNGACPAANRNAPLTLTRSEVLEMADHDIQRAVLIYKITHVVSGRSYIGITCGNLRKRWREYCWQARNDPSARLHRAIAKYGADAFSMVLLYEAVNAREAHAVERGLIASYGTMSAGFNLSSGGEAQAGVKRSPEVCQKISAGKMGHVGAFLGREFTPEHREAISRGKKGKPNLLLRGRTRPAEVGAKISAAKMGVKKSPEHRAQIAHTLRQRWTAEERAKLAARQTGARHSDETREKMKRSQTARRAAEKNRGGK